MLILLAKRQGRAIIVLYGAHRLCWWAFAFEKAGLVFFVMCEEKITCLLVFCV